MHIRRSPSLPSRPGVVAVVVGFASHTCPQLKCRYQNPAEADSIMKIQKELGETTQVLSFIQQEYTWSSCLLWACVFITLLLSVSVDSPQDYWERHFSRWKAGRPRGTQRWPQRTVQDVLQASKENQRLLSHLLKEGSARCNCKGSRVFSIQVLSFSYNKHM